MDLPTYGYLFGGSFNKDYSVVELLLGTPTLGDHRINSLIANIPIVLGLRAIVMGIWEVFV